MIYNKNNKINLKNLPDAISKNDFDFFITQLKTTKFYKTGLFDLAIYKDFKIEISKAVGACFGSYGLVGGEYRTIKTIYII